MSTNNNSLSQAEQNANTFAETSISEFLTFDKASGHPFTSLLRANMQNMMYMMARISETPNVPKDVQINAEKAIDSLAAAMKDIDGCISIAMTYEQPIPFEAAYRVRIKEGSVDLDTPVEDYNDAIELFAKQSAHHSEMVARTGGSITIHLIGKDGIVLRDVHVGLIK